MKTRYVLHGGFVIDTKFENDPYFTELLKETGPEVSVLLTYFASTTERIPRYYEEDKEQFRKNGADKKLHFEMAQKDTFIEQVKLADVIYIRGGRTYKALDALKMFSGLESFFSGKTIAADSASANALATLSYSKSSGICEGLGMLPIKIICHYRDEDRDVFAGIRPDLEIVVLREYEFKTFYRE